MRARLEPLSTSELVARYEELRAAATRDDQSTRAERAVIDHLLDHQERAAATAARLNPPGYITKTLGERPRDPAKRGEWDRAVRAIEGYRLRYAVRDAGSALGEAPRGAAARAARERARRRIERGQRRLGVEWAREVGRSISRAMVR